MKRERAQAWETLEQEVGTAPIVCLVSVCLLSSDSSAPRSERGLGLRKGQRGRVEPRAGSETVSN